MNGSLKKALVWLWRNVLTVLVLTYFIVDLAVVVGLRLGLGPLGFVVKRLGSDSVLRLMHRGFATMDACLERVVHTTGFVKAGVSLLPRRTVVSHRAPGNEAPR